MDPLKVIIVGAGSRGMTYAGYALEHPDRMKVIAVAEPREAYRQMMQDLHAVPDELLFVDWKQIAAREKFADLVVIATQDRMHADPAVAFANRGYDILLEKPMAPTEAECERITKAANDNKVTLAVCHILRYTKHTARVKELISSGAVGDVVSVQHFEPVGYWHQAHSFVRGNWRNEEISAPLLLAKSCHDLDWLHYIMGESCESIASFGGLYHFKPENQPEGAADRCLDCDVESSCPYSAPKLYLNLVKEGKLGWPVDILTPVVTEETVIEALRTGPYGRCAYLCDNDVVDNQVVSMSYRGGRTATFSVNAFNNVGGRKTRIFGTRGEIYLNVGDREEMDGVTKMTSPRLRHFDFMTEKVTYETIHDNVETALTGHHYGDYHLIDSVVNALRDNNPDLIVSGANATLESHRMVFAAERARRENVVVSL